MSIEFPIKAVKNDGARFATLKDATDRAIAGGLIFEDAEQLVKAANAGAKLGSQPLEKQPRRKNQRERLATQLRDSDPVAVIMERDNEIVYGHYDDLPQAGESVARLRR